MANLDSLRAALAVSPDNVPLLLLFAKGCLDEWAFEEARSAYEQALRVAPAEPEAKLGIARTLHLTGKTSEALVRTEVVTQDHATFAPGWVFLSQLNLTEGNREVALSQYAHALKLDPSVRDEAYETELCLQGKRSAGEQRGPEKVPVGVEGWDAPADEVDGQGKSLDIEKPKSNFNDVGGMDTVKEEIRMKIIYPLKNPELFRAYGKKVGGGVLLYGPPGCGKTMLSRATAGEINANFISIGLHQILDLYLGNSEKNLHELFQLARDNAPSVLFFDEVDALAADRNDLKRSAGRTLINQFLAEMDGQNASNDGLLILGATNAPWHIDPAFRRPGRFDRILFVPPPDDTARAAIIQVMAKNKPISNLDAAALARKTKDFSGADLKAVFDIAIERSLARAMREGRVIPITTADLMESAKSLKPSTRAWFDSAKNYAIYSNQGGFYDDVLTFLGIKK